MKYKIQRPKFNQITNKTVFKKLQTAKYLHSNSFDLSSTTSSSFNYNNKGHKKLGHSYLQNGHYQNNINTKSNESSSMNCNKIKNKRDSQMLKFQHEALRNRFEEKQNQLSIEVQVINQQLKIKLQGLQDQFKGSTEINQYLTQIKKQLYDQASNLKIQIQSINSHINQNGRVQNLNQKLKSLKSKIKVIQLSYNKVKNQNQEKTVILNELIQKIDQMKEKNNKLKQKQFQGINNLIQLEKQNFQLRQNQIQLQKKYYEQIKKQGIEVKKAQKISQTMAYTFQQIFENVRNKMQKLNNFKQNYQKQLQDQQEQYYEQIQQNVKLTYKLNDLKFILSKLSQGQMKWSQIKQSLGKLYIQNQQSLQDELEDQNNIAKQTTQNIYQRDTYLQRLSIKEWSIKQEEYIDYPEGIQENINKTTQNQMENKQQSNQNYQYEYLQDVQNCNNQ